MKNKRITEVIDSNGVSRFYPERKGLLWGWNRISMYEGFDYVSFDTYKEAKEWICYEHTTETKIHEVDCK